MVDYLSIGSDPFDMEVSVALRKQIEPRLVHRIKVNDLDIVENLTWVDVGHRSSRIRFNAYMVQYTTGKICYEYGTIGFSDPDEALMFNLRYVHEW